MIGKSVKWVVIFANENNKMENVVVSVKATSEDNDSYDRPEAVRKGKEELKKSGFNPVQLKSAYALNPDSYFKPRPRY